MKEPRLGKLSRREAAVLERVGAFIPLPGSACAPCAHARTSEAGLPAECRECAFSAERDLPYASLVPAWNEGSVPSAADARTAAALADRLARTAPDRRPREWADDPACRAGTEP